MGSGPVLHDVECGRLAKVARAAVRLGAPEATLVVSRYGARLFAADDPAAPAWWLDAMFGQPSATAGRALVAPPAAIVMALQRVGPGDVRVAAGPGAVRLEGRSVVAEIRSRVVPFGAGERKIPISNAWFDAGPARVVAAASLPWSLLATAVDVAAPRRAPDVQLRLARGPREWVLEVAGDALLHRVPVVVGVPPERVPLVGRYPAAVLGKLLAIAIDEPLTLEFAEPADAPALRARWVEADWSVEFFVAPAPPAPG